jgi:hypothetical protein
MPSLPKCSTSATVIPMPATRTTKAPISKSVDPTLLESPEKKSESRITAPKSATDEPVMTNCPKEERLCPASASTGTTMPSEVAESMIATSSGACMSPATPSNEATPNAITSESANPIPALRSAAQQAAEIDLHPSQEQQERQADQGHKL